MTRPIDISIVIPVYNASGTITGTVGSIISQNFGSYEVILVNDGSTDDSGAVCDRLALMYDAVRCIHTENRGVSAARNEGIHAATGKYVMFADSDDLLKEGALDNLYHDDCDFVLGGFEKVSRSRTLSYIPVLPEVYEGNEAMCRFFDETISEDNCYLLNSPCFKLFRRSVIEEHALGFVEGLSYAEDKIFVMSFLAHAQKVRTVDQIVYSYILQDVSLSSDLVSDRHISQVFLLLSVYSPLLKRLCAIYKDSSMLARLYHNDLVSRYVCRILTVFATRRSSLLSKDAIALLYDYMKADKALTLFSVRLGQIPNLLLFRLGSPVFAYAFYKSSSSLMSLFRR